MGEGMNAVDAWLRDRGADAEFLRFQDSVHTVEQAVQVSGHPAERFTKSIVMIAPDGTPVIAIVPASSRASTD